MLDLDRLSENLRALNLDPPTQAISQSLAALASSVDGFKRSLQQLGQAAEGASREEALVAIGQSLEAFSGSLERFRGVVWPEPARAGADGR
jgi:prefoldin subunit 5